MPRGYYMEAIDAVCGIVVGENAVCATDQTADLSELAGGARIRRIGAVRGAPGHSSPGGAARYQVRLDCLDATAASCSLPFVVFVDLSPQDCSSCNSSRQRAHARWRRDLTVPMDQPSTVAISPSGRSAP